MLLPSKFPQNHAVFIKFMPSFIKIMLFCEESCLLPSKFPQNHAAKIMNFA
jgi:hypothetical protein